MSALDLRPLSMGDVADRAFALYRARWLVLFAMATLSFGLFFFGWFFAAAAYAAAYFDNHLVSFFAVLLAAVMFAMFSSFILRVSPDLVCQSFISLSNRLVTAACSGASPMATSAT